MNLTQSNKHKVFSKPINKRILCENNEKIHILKDGIKTLAHGYFSIETHNSVHFHLFASYNNSGTFYKNIIENKNV
jgi:hypothetical protein